jgi:cytochrome c553
MKYLLPLFICVVFTACNDSSSTQNTQASSDSNTANQTQNVQTSTLSEVNTTASTTEINSTQTSGEIIFGKCKSCHGMNAEKSALGASQVIKGWDAAKIENTLHGYQNGTYGGSMKPVMAAQVKSLSDDEIKKVAKYIHSLQ